MLFFLFIFLLGIKGLGNGFSLLGGDLLDNIFQVTANPFLGLIVGVLTTSMTRNECGILQSQQPPGAVTQRTYSVPGKKITRNRF